MMPVPTSADALPTLRRRAFVAALPAALAGTAMLPACSQAPDRESHEVVAARIHRADAAVAIEDAAVDQGFGGEPGRGLALELVRLATLAPSSHDTQYWKFALQDQAITILPDLLRRCPAVDPDDHHVFVSLGCATENLVHAALAHGLYAQARFDVARDAVQVALTPTPAQRSALYGAITTRQCTRGDYDGLPLSSEELGLLERASTSSGVRLPLLTDRPAVERVLEVVVQANTAQMADPAFIRELKTWIRFTGA